MASLGRNLEIMGQVRRINKQLLSVVEQVTGPVEQTLLTQASLIASEQRALAPVDNESETPGALKATVRVERGAPTKKKALVIKIKAGGKKTEKSGKGGKDYDYGRAAEFGTVKQKARPFFFPVWRARRKEVRAAVRAVVKREVPKVFK